YMNLNQIMTQNEAKWAISSNVKSSLKLKLRELPTNAITHLMNELLAKGVANLPVAFQIIQKFLQ
ncbi:hypothetical protein PSI14_19180, partial [Xenorhabdus sp. XENO-2]|nr:hypothetical protein [Xenorhabdus anantnagensis]